MKKANKAINRASLEAGTKQLYRTYTVAICEQPLKMTHASMSQWAVQVPTVQSKEITYSLWHEVLQRLIWLVRWDSLEAVPLLSFDSLQTFFSFQAPPLSLCSQRLLMLSVGWCQQASQCRSTSQRERANVITLSEFIELWNLYICSNRSFADGMSYISSTVSTQCSAWAVESSGSDLSTTLESGAEVAELVKRWMGDVGAWCLPGYGVPLALILWKEEKNKCFVLSRDIFPLKDREEGWTSLQESVKRCKVNSNVILLDSWYWDLTVLTKRTVHLSTSYKASEHGMPSNSEGCLQVRCSCQNTDTIFH